MQPDLFPTPESEKKKRTWVKVGIGALALGVLLAAVFLNPSPSPPPVPPSLPIRVGTVFGRLDTLHWVAWFNVTEDAGRLVGAWAAHGGTGTPALVVVNGSVGKSASGLSCPNAFAWDVRTGSINTSVGPGPHTLYWASCFEASKVVVAEAIHVVATPTLVALGRPALLIGGASVAAGGYDARATWRCTFRAVP